MDAYEAEYAERLADENKPNQAQHSQYLAFFEKGRAGESWDDFYADELRGRDDQTRRLFALRGKIQTLRKKLGLPDEDPLPAEKSYLPAPPAAKKEKPHVARLLADPVPPGFFTPSPLMKSVLCLPNSRPNIRFWCMKSVCPTRRKPGRTATGSTGKSGCTAF